MTDLTAIPQKHSDMLADAWCSHDRQLAERFRRAMKKARAELGQGGNFTAVLKRAWALDPDLRGQFGAAVSVGLRRMWSDAAVRAEQSERIKQTYTESLRKRRSEALKKNWADVGFREKMLSSTARLPNGRFGPRDE
jgi:GAF domain-containing protein